MTWFTILVTIASIMIIIYLTISFIYSFSLYRQRLHKIEVVDPVVDDTMYDIMDLVTAMDSSKKEVMKSILDECYRELVYLNKK